jgi:hypothetical protein
VAVPTGILGDSMNTFIVELKNRPGELARVTEAIAHKGINITAFSGATCGGSGSIALLTNDETGTRNALREAGVSAREIELVSTTLDHQPGTLAAAARKLADAGINIEAALPIGMESGRLTLGFATDQPEKAKSLLGTPAMAGAPR